jgi:peroxiredoxin
MKRLMLFLSFLPLLTLAVQAAPAAGWLAVGDSLPAASVRSETDAGLTLRESVGGRPTVLIFYRGGWCPFCTRHLAALAEAAPELQAAGFQLLAISPDQPAKLRARPSHQKLPYTLLSDSEMKAAQACGIAFKVDDALVAKYKNDYGIDLEGDSGQTHHLLPHPAVFIVDREGVVRFAHVNPDYKLRLTPDEILAAARAALRGKKS